MVPVTPIMIISSAGRPNQLADSTASARRAETTRTQGTAIFGASSHKTQAAPFSAAMGMKAWPSAA